MLHGIFLPGDRSLMFLERWSKLLCVFVCRLDQVIFLPGNRLYAKIHPDHYDGVNGFPLQVCLSIFMYPIGFSTGNFTGLSK